MKDLLLTPEGKSRLFKLIADRYQKHLNLDDRSWNEETRVFINGLRDDIVTEVEAQLAKVLKHRSRPELREKIDKHALAGTHRAIPALEAKSGEVIDVYLTTASTNKILDQLLLLCPDEEDMYKATQQSFENGKREERERVQPFLEDSIEILTNAQGEWASVTETYAPEWTHRLKEVCSLIEEALKGER